jgi:hypothetical protein
MLQRESVDRSLVATFNRAESSNVAEVRMKVRQAYEGRVIETQCLGIVATPAGASRGHRRAFQNPRQSRLERGLPQLLDSLPIPRSQVKVVLDTVERIKDIRTGVMVLVDGDMAGDDYAKEILKAANPPEYVVQWPKGLEMEDVVGWVLGNEKSLLQAIQAEMPTVPATVPEIVAWLKKPTKEKGAKTDVLAYEAVAAGMTLSGNAKARARICWARLSI